MKIEVQNNVPGVKVSANQNADGSFAILLAEMSIGKDVLTTFSDLDHRIFG